jgi:predicted ribosome quality control (RQC) complex YloA/Tae2 family protein
MCLTAVVSELSPALVGARIDKIRQPERDVLILHLRTQFGNRKLLISTGTADARVHFTQSEPENPAQPPMFCMLLRKHLTGAVITSVTQPPRERVVDIALTASDTLGDREERRLVLELMGRNSNIALVGADGRVLDCLRRVDAEMSERRPLLPGLFYRLPPSPERANPGFSPLIAREIEYRGTDAFLSEPPVPTLLREPSGALRDFTFCEIRQYGGALECEAAESFSAMLDTFFARRSSEQRMTSKASNLVRTVKNAHDRAVRRVAAQYAEIESARHREHLRECGDILMANLKAVPPGAESVSLPDFYADGDAETYRTIKLDPRRNAQQNAAKYYKDYTKAKNAEKILGDRIADGEREAEYLGSVLTMLAMCESERELADIRRELENAGYLRAAKTREKVKPTAPRRFTSSSGVEILVGRNNAQNDELTFKLAFKTDVWLHVQKRHGSHVILRTNGADPSDSDILEAAAYAAQYSEARDELRVAVDFTRVRYVKKIPAANAGMVTYTDYKTVIVAPSK